MRCMGSELEDPSEIKPRYGDDEMVQSALKIFAESC